jgi:hypothetical protein
VYSIVTGISVPNISLRIDNKQLIQADSNAVFEFKTSKRKVSISAVPENIYHFDSLLFVQAITDTVKLFIAYPVDSSLAGYDIAHSKLQFFCGGGIAPVAIMPADKIFEIKYSVKYHLLDCFMPELDDLNAYNQQVALYLDKRYGTGWRQTVRPDIFGVTRKDP